MLTTKGINDNNDSSDGSFTQSNENSSLDNQAPFLPIEIDIPQATKAKAKKHFPIMLPNLAGITNVMEKMNPLLYLPKLPYLHRDKEDDMEETKERRDSQLEGLSEEEKELHRLNKRKKLRRKYNPPPWLKIPDLLDNVAVDKLREWTGFRKNSNAGLDGNENQWQRPKGWRLVRAAVTIIIWSKRSLEVNEKIMKGKEGEKKKEKGRRFYISPKSKFKIMWDSFISLTMLYYAFVTPLRWSQGIFTSQWMLVDQLLDMMTWIDIFLSFITGIAMNKYLVKRRGQIAKRYLRTYFLFDLVSVLPLYMLNNGWYFLKLLRLVHFKRAYNLLKRVAIAYPRGMSILNFFKAFFYFITVLNLLAAIWIYVGRIDVQQGSWILALSVNFNHSLYDAITLFIIAETFVVNTVTTVGYGDVVPKKTIEMAVAMCYEFSGIIISALLQADFDYLLRVNLMSYVRAENSKYEEWISIRLAHREKFRTKLEQMGGIPRDVKATLKSIKKYFRFVHLFAYRALTYKHEFYKKMPAQLKMKLSLPTFEPLIRKFSSFFDHFDDDSFKYDICSRLRPEIFSNYDIICKEQLRPKGLYFILKGRVLIWHNSARLFEAHEGFYFGDFLALGMTCLLEMTAGYEPVHCLYVPYKEVLEICSRYAEQTATMQRVAFQRLEVFNNSATNKRKRTRNTSILSIEIEEEDEGIYLLYLFSLTFYKDIPQDSMADLDVNSMNQIENPRENSKTAFEFDENILARRAMRRSLTTNFNIASPSVKYAANIIQKHNEVRSAGLKNRSRNESYISQVSKKAETTVEDVEYEERGVPDDSGSDSDSELNNSLEVPIEDAMLSFEDTRENEEIFNYLEERTQAIKYKLIRLQNTYREEVLLEWKRLKILLRKTVPNSRGARAFTSK